MENSNLGNRLLKPREIMGSKSDVGFRSNRFEEEQEDVEEETEGLSKEEDEKERGLDLVVAHQVEERADNWNKSKFEEFNKFLTSQIFSKICERMSKFHIKRGWRRLDPKEN